MDVELDVTRTDAHKLHIELRLDGTLLGAVQQTPRGTFDADARLEMLDTETGEVRDLDAALEDAPPTVYFGDGTVVVGTSSSSPTIDEGTDPPAFARAVSWNGVDLRAEASNPKQAHITIQDATLRMARAGATWVITDHGSGEMADFIALTLDDNRVDVESCTARALGKTLPRASMISTMSSVKRCAAFDTAAPPRVLRSSSSRGSTDARR